MPTRDPHWQYNWNCNAHGDDFITFSSLVTLLTLCHFSGENTALLGLRQVVYNVDQPVLARPQVAQRGASGDFSSLRFSKQFWSLWLPGVSVTSAVSKLVFSIRPRASKFVAFSQKYIYSTKLFVFVLTGSLQVPVVLRDV